MLRKIDIEIMGFEIVVCVDDEKECDYDVVFASILEIAPELLRERLLGINNKDDLENLIVAKVIEVGKQVQAQKDVDEEERRIKLPLPKGRGFLAEQG